MMGFSDGSGISWTICKQSAPRSRQITIPTPHHSIFIDRMLFLTPNQQFQSIEGKQSTEGKTDMQTPRAMDTEMAKLYNAIVTQFTKPKQMSITIIYGH